MKKKESVIWDPKNSVLDRRLLFGIKVLFWVIILLAMAGAVYKYLWKC